MKEEKAMIERIINDCEQALEHNLYFAALNLALTLPDICGKAKYPAEKSNKKRYVDWFEEYIGQYNKYPKNEKMPYQSGEIIYSLRCSVLHQGNPSVDEKQCNLTHFSLIYETKKPYDIYACESSSVSETQREIRLHIRSLCWRICTVAKDYYDENKEQFNFFNYDLVDWDKVIEHMRKMNCPPPYETYLEEIKERGAQNDKS